MSGKLVQKQILERLGDGGVAVLIGMYGMGKGRVVENFKGSSLKVRVVRVSFKDLPVPADDDIPEICGYSSWVRLHAGWRRRVEKMRKRGEKLMIVIEGVEQLLPHGARLWEILTSLLYYQKGKVQIILSGTAGVVDGRDLTLRRLIRGNVVWAKAMDREEMGEVMREHEESLGYPVTRYESAIARIARGHYGTVKYLCQLIASNRYEGEKLSESRIIKWAEERGDVEYFVRRVWKGYSNSQQRVIRRYLENRRNLGGWQKKTVEEIVKSGLWYRGGREFGWRVGWVEKAVREYVRSLPEEKIEELGEEEMGELGKKERVVVESLWSRRGEAVSYDELSDEVTGVEESYSMWALSRLVARVRGKLARIAPGVVIETVRGVGYRMGG